MNFLTLTLSLIIMISSSLQNQDSLLLNASLMKTENKWRVVNDGVMGGLSSSKAFVEDDKIIFSGNVSLENNGGFASLRSPVKDYNFEKYNGIEIKIKGVGKQYSISMKETYYFTGYFYTTSFDTKKDEWMVIKISFDKFKLYYYGKETNSKKKIPLSNIKEVSLMIGHKQEGSFKAEIEYLWLY